MVCFAWGVTDGGINNFLSCICGFQFDSKVLPFSILQSFKALFCFALVYMQSFLTSEYQYTVYLASCCVFTLIGWVIFVLLFSLKTELAVRVPKVKFMNDSVDTNKSTETSIRRT